MKEIDTDRIEKAVREILVALGDDPEREGLKDTPKRVAKMYKEVFEGMCYTNEEIAEKFTKCFEQDGDNLVVVKNIECFSYCEHHMALMYDLTVSIAYLPHGKVIGLSKLARIADMVCKRLQLQERIGEDIAEIVQIATGSEDVAVFISGTHSCMTARGVKKQNATTTTHTLKGKFKTCSDLRREAESMIYN